MGNKRYGRRDVRYDDGVTGMCESNEQGMSGIQPGGMEEYVVVYRYTWSGREWGMIDIRKPS